MDVAFISGLSALAGSIIGGVTSAATTWMNQRAQARVAWLANDLSRRENLFRDFIIAASKTYGEATQTNEPQLQDLIALYALISRMRVRCTPRTVACAEKVADTTVNSYFAPKMTIGQLHALIKSGKGVDPFKEFAEAARDELQEVFSL
jgi:hypothetical protein